MNAKRVVTGVRMMQCVPTKSVRSLARANTVTLEMAECVVRKNFRLSFVLQQDSHARLAPNECFLGKHNCHANAVCRDTDDGFTCTCKPGFHGDGTLCGTFDFVYPIADPWSVIGQALNLILLIFSFLN